MSSVLHLKCPIACEVHCIKFKNDGYIPIYLCKYFFNAIPVSVWFYYHMYVIVQDQYNAKTVPYITSETCLCQICFSIFNGWLQGRINVTRSTEAHSEFTLFILMAAYKQCENIRGVTEESSSVNLSPCLLSLALWQVSAHGLAV